MPQVGIGDEHNQDSIDIIIRVARQLHVPPILALAIAQHESGFNPKIAGDNGHSIGLYQLYDQGEGAGKSVAWRQNPWNNARTALREVSKVLHQHPHWTWGQIAAAAQRPADRTNYAAAVQAIADGVRQHVDNGLNATLYGSVPGARMKAIADYYRQGVQPYYSSSSHTNAGGGGGGNGGGGNGGGGAGAGGGGGGGGRSNQGVSNTIGTGGGGAGSGGNDLLTPSLNVGDFKAGLDAAGFAMALIKSDDGLMKVYRRAITQGWYKSDTGLSRFQAAIKNTHWWQSRTESQRKFDEQWVNPAERKNLNDQLAKSAESLGVQAHTLGLDVGDGVLNNLAKLSLRNGLTDQQVAKALSSHFTYDRQAAYTGVAGTSIDQVKQLASDYFVNVGDHQMQKWVQQTMSGELDPASLTDFFKKQAASMFPYLQKQIDQGQTVASIADPYRQMMANELELDPNGVANNNRLIMQGLQSKDQKTGDLGLMPLWQFQQTLRNDPRWLKTQGAQDNLMDVGTGLLRQFGLIT